VGRRGVRRVCSLEKGFHDQEKGGKRGNKGEKKHFYSRSLYKIVGKKKDPSTDTLTCGARKEGRKRKDLEKKKGTFISLTPKRKGGLGKKKKKKGGGLYAFKKD